MGSKFSLEAILSLTDNLTRPYKSTTRNVTALNRGLQGSFNRLNDIINRTGAFVGTQLKRAAMVGMVALAGATTLAAKEFIDLDSSITNAAAKFKDLDSTSRTFSDSLKDLSMAARAVGADTEFSATDASGALDKFAMAGMSSAQSMALLRGTTDLATAAGTDLTTAVDIATDSLGAFQLVTNDTIQLEKNLARVSDVMAKTTTTANTSLEDMFEAVKMGGPAFTDAGQSVESFSALIGVMANSGIKGGQAGTNLRNVMLRLAKPTAEAADVLKDLGVRTTDSAGNFRDVVDIIADFQKGLAGMGTAERSAALTTIFGQRAITGFSILLSEGADNLRAYRQTIIDSSGAANQMAETIRGSISNQIKVLKSGLTELGLQFISAFEKDGRGALQSLIDAVQKFDMHPIINGVRTAANFFRMIKAEASPVIQSSMPMLNDTFNQVKQSIINIVPSLVTTFDILKQFGSWLKTSGVLDLSISMMKAFAASIRLSGNAFRILWKIAKPILDAIFFVLKPIIKMMEAMANFSAAGATGISGFVEGTQERRTQRQARRELRRIERRGVDPVAAAAEREAIVERQRDIDDSRMRNDVYLNAPAGWSMSTTPGGAPETAVNLGAQ